MKILVVGQGAREHAILHSLAKENAHELLAVGSNPGIDELAEQALIEDDTISEIDGIAIATFCKENLVDLVIIGPEAPLATGVVDEIKLRAPNTAVFGPTRAATQLESSKAFAKDIMFEANVPTASAHTCRTIEEVVLALKDFGAPYVVKADGLAAGKGVVVTSDFDTALAHASDCLGSGDGSGKDPGESKVVIEDYLDGPEFSLFFICDGKTAIPLLPAQDFKRIFDNDEGPNTGGMGAYTPLAWLPDNTIDWCTKYIATPVLEAMSRRGMPFTGVLFAGLAYTSKGIRVIEFNARFGDPETQVVLEKLVSPLSELLMTAAKGELAKHYNLGQNLNHNLKWDNNTYCNIVLASAGYPASSHKGDVITGILAAKASGAIIFEAGTAYASSDIGQIVTNGGRVLSVVAKAADLLTARNRAYNLVKLINFDGMQYRTDIAQKAAQGQISVDDRQISVS